MIAICLNIFLTGDTLWLQRWCQGGRLVKPRGYRRVKHWMQIPNFLQTGTISTTRRFDGEVMSFEWSHRHFRQPRAGGINIISANVAMASGEVLQAYLLSLFQLWSRRKNLFPPTFENLPCMCFCQSRCDTGYPVLFPWILNRPNCHFAFALCQECNTFRSAVKRL